MLKDYECVCGAITEFKKQYKVDFPQTVKCKVCGKEASICYRKTSLPKINIPEHMRAALDFEH